MVAPEFEKRIKIMLLGNILPIWDDPLWLAESLAEIEVLPPDARESYCRSVAEGRAGWSGWLW